LDLKIETGGGE